MRLLHSFYGSAAWSKRCERGECVAADPEGAIAATYPRQTWAELFLGPKLLAKVFLGLVGFNPGGSVWPFAGRLIFAEVVEAA